MSFRDEIPKHLWPELLEDVQVQAGTGARYKSPEDLLDHWLEIWHVQLERHERSKALDDMRHVVSVVENDPNGALVFFRNVWAYVTHGVRPVGGWNTPQEVDNV